MPEPRRIQLRRVKARQPRRRYHAAKVSMQPTTGPRGGFEVVIVRELGRLRFNGQTWAIAIAPLRKRGWRGVALTPKRKPLVGAIVCSTHLNPDCPKALEAWIHETLHVALPRTKEKAIAKAAHLVARVLTLVERSKRP